MLYQSATLSGARAAWGAGRKWYERRHLWEIVTFFCYRITELGARITLLSLFAVRTWGRPVQLPGTVARTPRSQQSLGFVPHVR